MNTLSNKVQTAWLSLNSLASKILHLYDDLERMDGSSSNAKNGANIVENMMTRNFTVHVAPNSVVIIKPRTSIFLLRKHNFNIFELILCML